MKKLLTLIAAILIAGSIYAGGLVTNTNHSGLYTRLMRDEILAELVRDGDGATLHVYCHLSGGVVLGTAGWRYRIFKNELPLVLEAIRYGDRAFFKTDPTVNQTQVTVHFVSHKQKYNKTENWGELNKYA